MHNLPCYLEHHADRAPNVLYRNSLVVTVDSFQVPARDYDRNKAVAHYPEVAKEMTVGKSSTYRRRNLRFGKMA